MYLTQKELQAPFYAETSERARRLSLELSVLYQLTLNLPSYQLALTALPSESSELIID